MIQDAMDSCGFAVAQKHGLCHPAASVNERKIPARFCLEAGHICLPQIKDADIQPAQESAPAMLVALESGRTDLVVTDMPTAKAACVAYPDLKLLDFTDTDDDFAVSDEEINIGISVQKGNTELLDGINSVLDTMTVDDFNSMMDEAISVQPLSE